MSTGPLCRLCKTSHWTRELCSFMAKPTDSKRKQRKVEMRALIQSISAGIPSAPSARDKHMNAKKKARATNKVAGGINTVINRTTSSAMCGTATNRHTATQPATNAATNATSATATNTATNPVAVPDKTLNRRERADYNAYQREYMRKRRTVKKVTTAILGKKNG